MLEYIHTYTTNTRMAVPPCDKKYAEIYFEALHTLENKMK
jgi:hypothetical protein